MSVRRVFAGLFIVGLVFWPKESSAGIDDSDPLPPLSVAGVRRVDLRNESGGLTSYASIPWGSEFRSYGGGGGAPCLFVAPADGYTSDGQVMVQGQLVLSQRWIFREELPVSFGEPNPAQPASAGPLASAVRSFLVFCDAYDANHTVGFVQVPPSDPMLDPHVRLDSLYNGLQLVRPVVYHDPVIDRWGGLVVRLPAWLAIDPAGWTPTRSNPSYYRGWVLYLLSDPATLEFLVDFRPNPDKPSAAFRGVVGCVGGETAPPENAGGPAFPIVPLLPLQTEPGVNGLCEWTPPGPGVVTLQARVTYHITFWANGFTETQPDYVWTSEPVTVTTGELTAVNLEPTS